MNKAFALRSVDRKRKLQGDLLKKKIMYKEEWKYTITNWPDAVVPVRAILCSLFLTVLLVLGRASVSVRAIRLQHSLRQVAICWCIRFAWHATCIAWNHYDTLRFDYFQFTHLSSTPRLTRTTRTGTDIHCEMNGRRKREKQRIQNTTIIFIHTTKAVDATTTSAAALERTGATAVSVQCEIILRIYL